MKQYKVIALSVGGKSNKIYNAGDIVNENNFIPGRADELVKLKFLELYKEGESTAGSFFNEGKEGPDPAIFHHGNGNEGNTCPTGEEAAGSGAGADTAGTDEKEGESPGSSGDEGKESEEAAGTFGPTGEEVREAGKKPYDQVTKEELVKVLVKAGVPFDPGAKKGTLYKIYIKL